MHLFMPASAGSMFLQLLNLLAELIFLWRYPMQAKAYPMVGINWARITCAGDMCGARVRSRVMCRAHVEQHVRGHVRVRLGLFGFPPCVRMPQHALDSPTMQIQRGLCLGQNHQRNSDLPDQMHNPVRALISKSEAGPAQSARTPGVLKLK